MGAPGASVRRVDDPDPMTSSELRERGLVRWGRWASIVTEVVLAVLGVWYVATLGDELLLALWCVIATAYTVVAIVALSSSAWRRHPGRPAAIGRFTDRSEYVVSVVSTLLASVVGLWASAELILLHSAEQSSGQAAQDYLTFSLLGVWAMLLSWGLLHWGFTQVYRHLYYARTPRPLRFPGDADPTVVDFAYFSFTLGTSFATNDVETRDRGVRWVMVIHSVVSFFFNALVIVLALNTVMTLGS